MAAVSDQTTTTAAPSHAWKVPRGGERNRQAVCYWAGPFMQDEMKNSGFGKLKKVPAEEIRDGSVPMTQDVTEKVDETWTDEVHVPDAVPELAHINDPKEGAVIEREFLLHFVDPTTYDRKIKLLFKADSEADSRDHPTLELDTFGNQIKRKLERPADSPSGSCTLVVQMLEKEQYIDKAQVRVQLA